MTIVSKRQIDLQFLLVTEIYSNLSVMSLVVDILFSFQSLIMVCTPKISRK